MREVSSNDSISYILIKLTANEKQALLSNSSIFEEQALFHDFCQIPENIGN